jgi:hypothetical protein
MAKKRQFCNACNQITTQTRKRPADPWTCLCCESAKARSATETDAIRKRSAAKKRLNLDF